MDYVTLGQTGLKVSKLCLGTMTYGDPGWRSWVLPEDAGRPFIKRALEYGINFFDTADMYSIGASEEILGRAVRDFARRDDVVVATKVFHPMSADPNDRGLSRKHIMSSIDGSLRRLGTDYVDLYQIHRWDPETPIEETLLALHDVVRSHATSLEGSGETGHREAAARAVERPPVVGTFEAAPLAPACGGEGCVAMRAAIVERRGSAPVVP